MAIFWRRLCLNLMLVATIAAAGTMPSVAAPNGCLDPVQANALVKSGKIMTWPAIRAKAGISRKYREIGAVRVCEQGGQPYYVVNVASPSGESKTLRVNAVTGAK